MLWAGEILISHPALSCLADEINLNCKCYTSCVLHLTVLLCVVLCFHVLSYMVSCWAWLAVIAGNNMLCNLYRKCVTSCVHATLCLCVCISVYVCASACIQVITSLLLSITMISCIRFTNGYALSKLHVRYHRVLFLFWQQASLPAHCMCVTQAFPDCPSQTLYDHSLTSWCLLDRPDAADPPNCLLNAHKLTSIRLSGNYYSAVPTYLSSVTALQSLHIANNAAIGSGCTACLSHLTALTKLVMQQCNLTAVPQSLAALSRLKWLCLSRNMLESVPEGLPWQHLELLHLRGNQLTCVPCDALSTAVQLETVDCGENLPLQVRELLRPKSSCHSSLFTSCG